MKTKHQDVIIIGSGPGGYAAAFHLADHGKSVLLIEKDDIGGVCLNRGCIPSKALLNVAGLIDKTKKSSAQGLTFKDPVIDLNEMRHWKNSVVAQLRGGIETLAKARNVSVLKGRAIFENETTLRVETENGQEFHSFNHAIIATGSRPFIPPAMDLGNPRIMTSNEALTIDEIPKELLVVGGGYIGMELGSVYASLGSTVSVVEAMPSILPGADKDLVNVLKKYVSKKIPNIFTDHQVKQMKTKGKKISVDMVATETKKNMEFDKVLISVGRKPNANDLGLENTNVKVDDKGFIITDACCETTNANIFAIGDVAGGIQLAHKATKEAKIAAAKILNETSLELTHLCIPAVVFTDPEIAWVGITENEARQAKQKVNVHKFPWTASGRALTLNRTEGLTKVISEPNTGTIIGVGIVGEHAGDLISEAALAIQSGLNVIDLAETIHPHPTLSETLMESAEHALGLCTHLMPAKK